MAFCMGKVIRRRVQKKNNYGLHRPMWMKCMLGIVELSKPPRAYDSCTSHIPWVIRYSMVGLFPTSKYMYRNDCSALRTFSMLGGDCYGNQAILFTWWSRRNQLFIHILHYFHPNLVISSSILCRMGVHLTIQSSTYGSFVTRVSFYWCNLALKSLPDGLIGLFAKSWQESGRWHSFALDDCLFSSDFFLLVGSWISS